MSRYADEASTQYARWQVNKAEDVDHRLSFDQNLRGISSFTWDMFFSRAASRNTLCLGSALKMHLGQPISSVITFHDTAYSSSQRNDQQETCLSVWTHSKSFAGPLRPR